MDKKEIAIVGGGIAGLYCCLYLVKQKIGEYSVKLYEASGRVGGKINSWHPKGADDLVAEFGPMRIEPHQGGQPRLNTLLRDVLGIKDASASDAEPGQLIRFPPYTSENPADGDVSLDGEEGQQETTLDLLKLGIRRILEVLDLDGHEAAWTDETQKHFADLLKPDFYFRRYWKGTLQEWISHLRYDDFQILRKYGKLEKYSLCDMGFWNVLSDVLSHRAVIKIRDWGNFYHLLPENPNAAEWLIFWLRAFQTSSALRGIEGDMDRIVEGTDQIKGLRKEIVEAAGTGAIATGRRLERLQPTDNGQIELVFKTDASDQSEIVDHVILAMPKRPLEKLDWSQCFAGNTAAREALQRDIDSVFGFPLLKCFFVVNDPWWEDDRPPNRYASRIPTRELHYWKSKDKSKGLIMIYTDQPGVQFWGNYFHDKFGEQNVPETWDTPGQIPPRLIGKFLQYLRDNGLEDVGPDCLLQGGMRDWGRDPYGGAAHAWRPGVCSWEVIERLKAFSLLDYAGQLPRNVHVCGEAYSDYQGFIEGALSSAENALVAVTGESPITFA